MKKVLTALFVLFSTLPILAIDLDSLQYTSQFEFNIFKNYTDSSVIAPIDFLVSFEYSDSEAAMMQKAISDLIKELEDKGIRNMPLKQQVKLIHKYTHAKLLKKYDMNYYFSDIFKTGYYNCVSASSLFTLILDRFNLPYQIKETPQHVYIIVDPENSQIVLESTQANNGVVVYSEQQKRDFVNYLQKNKLISADEYTRKTINELFNEYFDKNTSITKYQLYALQYYNKGVGLFNDSKYKDASVCFEKAYLIYPSHVIQYMFNISLTNILNEQIAKKEFDGKTLGKYLQINSSNFEAVTYSNNFFNHVSEELMLQHPNQSAYSLYYENLTRHLCDSALKSSFEQSYYYYLGYYNYANMNYAEALSNLNLAYLSNSENIRVKTMVQDIGIKYMFDDRNHEQTINKLNYYFDVFPFLSEVDVYLRYYSYCYFRVISDAFKFNEPSKGLAFIDKFNEEYSGFNTASIDVTSAESAFMSASAYYVSKKMYSKALACIDKGLILIPDSREFKQRRKLLSESIATLNEYTASIAVPLPPESLEPNEYAKYFLENFSKCWKLKESTRNKLLGDYSKSCQMQIVANKDLTFSIIEESKKINGTWALRGKSKLLYLIPEKDKKKYLVFYVAHITPTTLLLKMYDENILSTEICEFNSCK